MTDNTSSLPLPDNPDLEWLRKEAKRQLRTLQATNPDAQLSDAQFQMATQYGFPSWRALKSHIDGLTFAPLVASALEQAERSSPAVKAAALLSVARVVSASDQADGVRVLERGTAIAQTLREPTRRVLLSEAFTVAAMLSPNHAFALLGELEDVPFFHLRGALYRMIEHGHHDAAVRYLLSAPEEPDFPFDAVDQALSAARDNETRIALLRKATRALLRAFARPATAPFHPIYEFSRILNDYWWLLPADEASRLVRELVGLVTARADERGTFSLQGMRFTSAREHSLFLLLGPCRHLEPRLAERLVADYSQLAKAAATFPNGLESIDHQLEQSAAQRPPQERQEEPDVEQPGSMDYLSLDEGLVPMADELRTDFRKSFELALTSYAIDTDRRRPNTAPQQCWPSAHNFRSILYKAGQYQGRAAVRHLDRVPDPALRLFAQIELAAALAGLPQLGGTTMNQAPELPSRRSREERPEFDLPAPPPLLGKPDIPPSYDVHIVPTRPDRARGPNGGCDADFWVIEGAPLRPVLAELFEISPVRIVLPQSVEHTRYDFTLVLPREEPREVLFATMRTGVERHFKVRRERRAVDVQIVTAARGVQAHESFTEVGGLPGVSGGSFEFAQMSSTPSAPDVGDLIVASLMDLSIVPPAVERIEDDLRQVNARFLRTFGAGALRGIHDSLTMTALCLALETSLKRIFVDETGTTATYRINIQADVPDSDAFLRVLCEGLGLTITSGRRDIELLVVEG